MNRIVSLCAVALATAALSCHAAAVDPCANPLPLRGEFLVSPSSLHLAPGGRGNVVVVAGVDPRCGTPLQVGWSVSDTTVAAVERDTGTSTTVVGRAPGTASVVARILSDPAIRAAAAVWVDAP